ncbi:MAG: hypothetical protein ABFC84_10365 [Veillonellales bacterium]
MNNIISHCIDINTQYCPCLLAETNHCVFCSHLKGKITCDCNWTGVCILYEKHWQSKKNRWRDEESAPIRTEVETKFKLLQQISETAFLLELSLPADFTNQLNKTGAFVFLRRPQDPYFYHFPVGVMKVSNTMIQLVVETVGPKSARIFDDKEHLLLVRGPYYNGIFGQPWIDNVTHGEIILVAGGIGQAPAFAIASKLVSRGNQVLAILAPGHMGKVFIADEMRRLGVQVHVVESLRREGMTLLKQKLSSVPDLIVSAGPDEQHYGIMEAMGNAGVNIPMAATNNATMCCGEGICGSCEQETRRDGRIRTCKVQTRFEELLND